MQRLEVSGAVRPLKWSLGLKWLKLNTLRFGDKTVPLFRLAYAKTTIIYLLAYLFTYLLTPWSRVLLENLTGSQLVKKFPAFYGTRRFITAFTAARHLSLSWARSIHSMTPHPTSWRSILMLSSIYTWVSFRQISLPKHCTHLSSPPYVLHSPTISFFSIWSPERYWVRSADH